MIFEVQRIMTNDLGYSPEELESFLDNFGYSIRALRDGKWTRISLSGFDGPEDLVALPNTTLDATS